MSDSPSHEALEELSHALQIARPLIRALRIELTDQARTAVQAEAAIDRALDALLKVQKGGAR
jgi:hypothetical protein